MGQNHPKAQVGHGDLRSDSPKHAELQSANHADKENGSPVKSQNSDSSALSLRKQTLFMRTESSSNGPTTDGDKSVTRSPTIGPNRLRRLFRHHSATRIGPGDSEGSGAESVANSPSPTDNNTNHMFLFSGTLSPVAFAELPETKEGFLTPTQLYNCFHDGQLSPYMSDPTFMLIIDTRSLQDFEKLHIATARHVSDLAVGEYMEPLHSYTMLILYDHKGLAHTLKDSVLSQTLINLQKEALEPFVLIGGFDTFLERHRYLCTSKVAHTGYERQKLIGSYPSIIVKDQIYLGRADQAASRKIIRNLNITHVVNVTRDHVNVFEEGGQVQYLKVPLDDDSNADLLREFPAAIEFMVGALNHGGQVLVHCNLGISRSSTVLIAYLMYTRRCVLRDAYRYLRERRPVVRPNKNFMRQLQRFEVMLFGRKLTDVTLLYGHYTDDLAD